MSPTREIYWNIPAYLLLYPLFIISLAVFAYGLRRRMRLWRLGTREGPGSGAGSHQKPGDGARRRLGRVIALALGHSRFFRTPFPGVAHFLLFWGFAVLVLGTIIVFLEADSPLHFYYGPFYLAVSSALELAGIAFLLGILFLAGRRYLSRPDQLDQRGDDAVALLLLFFLAVSGFLIEGLRIYVQHSPWEAWSFVGAALARLAAAVSLSDAAAAGLHRILWWLHLAATLGFIVYIPYSRLLHIITSPLNIWLAPSEPKGTLRPMDLEESEIFGTSQINEFSQKQLLDLDACTRCGRCQAACPAYLSEKPLTPKRVIQDLRDHLTAYGPSLLAASSARASDSDAGGGQSKVPAQAADLTEELPLVTGQTIAEDVLWACTTCAACETECPVLIRVIDKIADMRRYLVLSESTFPSELRLFFKNMETNFNPWGIGWSTRADWAEGLEIPVLSEVGSTELLYWAGCAASFDERNKKVAVAFCALLGAAGVEFAILGTEEKCCGETSRRLGNEYLYQMMAMENVEIFKQYGVKRIVTACPHCYNSFKHEYREQGVEIEVFHHSELLASLVEDGRLRLGGGTPSGTPVFHDSCYLGRYNDVFDAPRAVVAAASGSPPQELPRARDRSFCCGAGGGRMWMEETLGQRINEIRTREALEAGATTICTTCPYCLTMFEDGLKAENADDRVSVRDVAELAAQAVNAAGEAPERRA